MIERIRRLVRRGIKISDASADLYVVLKHEGLSDEEIARILGRYDVIVGTDTAKYVSRRDPVRGIIAA